MLRSAISRALSSSTRRLSSLSSAIKQSSTKNTTSDPISDFDCEQGSVSLQQSVKFDPLGVGMWRNPEAKYSPEQQGLKINKNRNMKKLHEM